MVQTIGPSDLDVTIKFGGGLHTRASEDEIDPREAADGQNFLLDLENRQLRNRPPFDLVGTVPNGAEIRGGGSLLKTDGTVSLVIQAGSVIYEWDGESGFTSVGSASSTARLRGHWRTHNFTLDDKLLLTDLALVDPVKEWDGATFQNVTFTKEDDTAFGTFKARYLSISNERAVFFNVSDPGAVSPHLIVGSESGDYSKISVAQRPASSLSESDPFFLLAPDLRAINGAAEAFGTTIVSTEKGQIFNLSGESAKDFAFDDFYPGSAAAGRESIAYIGNDLIYGRPGRIESVRDTDRFGDSETDDLSRPISDRVQSYSGWTIVYNSRLNRAYLFPAGQSEVWVFNTAMLGGELSPWMRWTTTHPLAFQPTFVMSMLDPGDGLEYVFMGDESGNWHRMEGEGTSGDGGSAAIRTEILTSLMAGPLDAQTYQIEGQIKYRKNEAATVEIRFEYAGEAAFTESIVIEIPGVSGAPHWGGEIYWGGDWYFGAAEFNKLLRQRFAAPGQGNELQVRVIVTGTTNFEINEIQLRGTAAS